MDDPALLPPALIRVAGASPELLEAIFASAAEFFDLAPWKLLAGETPIEIRYPRQAVSRLVVILGAAGEAFGLCAYDRAADLNKLLKSKDPLATASALNWLALTYEGAEYLAAEDVMAARLHGWRVANEQAYPAIARIGSPGPELHPPSWQDLLWLAGALPALNAFFRSPLQWRQPGVLQPVSMILAVRTLEGLAEAEIIAPAPEV